MTTIIDPLDLHTNSEITEKVYRRCGYRDFLAHIGDHRVFTWENTPNGGRYPMIGWPAGEWITDTGLPRKEKVGWKPPITVVAVHVTLDSDDTVDMVATRCARQLDRQVAHRLGLWLDHDQSGDVYSATSGLMSKLFQDEGLVAHYLVRTEVAFGVKVS